MILDDARGYIGEAPGLQRANVPGGKSSGCFNCGSMDHWASECPRSGEKGEKGKGHLPSPTDCSKTERKRPVTKPKHERINSGHLASIVFHYLMNLHPTVVIFPSHIR